METLLNEDQWTRYVRDGYLRLGQLLDERELTTLQDRIDAIMLGEADVNYDRMLMQLDSDTGEYNDAGVQSRGHKGATLNYRKIEQLEFDPVFLEYLQRPVFNEICARTYGGHVPIAAFRSMFMNKPAGKGTKLPWHQDRWNALDPATRENGCVRVIPDSHRFGVLNPSHGSGFLTDDMASEQCRDEDAVDLVLEPGEAVLLHNWLLHGSDKNRSPQSRRALSVCYMDARTVEQHGRTFPVIFGEGALTVEEVRAMTAV